MPYVAMQILVYLILGTAVIFYVVLDGFDLGVGSLQIFPKTDKDRRIFLNSIGPFWDGNEVWLIVIAGVLFVGFPDAYATIFSGFYILIMCTLFGIICRAVAIEFRSKMPGKGWRAFWDFVFWLSSIIITFSVGLFLGNLVRGVPVDAQRELYYSFGALFSVYAIFVGVTGIFLFAMHGNMFLLLKTEGKLQKWLHNLSKWTITLFYLFFIATTIWTWIEYPYMVERFGAYPIFLIIPAVLLLSLIGLPVLSKMKMYGWAFLCSMLVITTMFLLYGVGTYPNILTSTLKPEYSLTLYNASSSSTTLGVTLIIAVIGVPLVLAYGWLLYYIFRGKTQLHDHSY